MANKPIHLAHASTATPIHSQSNPSFQNHLASQETPIWCLELLRNKMQNFNITDKKSTTEAEKEPEVQAATT